MWRRVAIVRTKVSEELIASIIRVKGIGELESTLLNFSFFVCWVLQEEAQGMCDVSDLHVASHELWWKRVWELNLPLYLTNWAPSHEGLWVCRCIDPRFHDLGTSWRKVASFTLHPLYPQWNSPCYPMVRRLNVPVWTIWSILDATGVRSPTLWASFS
jgi:hypothetical protein